MRRRLLLLATLALAGAATGTAIPSLRLVLADFGVGGAAAGAFLSLHIAGMLVGAFLWSRLLAIRAARTPVALALAAEALLAAAQAGAGSLPALLALRFADGIAHVGVVMAIMGPGNAGQSAGRTRGMVHLGTALVLGVGAGMGLGGALAGRGIAVPFWAAAALDLAAALIAWPALTGIAPRRPVRERRLAAAVLAPPATLAVIMAAAERLALGMITILLPFLAEDAGGARRSGALLGVFMTCSVAAMPLARRAIERWGAPAVARCALLSFAAVIATLGAAGSLLTGIPWAVVGGGAAGSIYTTSLVLVARGEREAERARAAGLIHACGSAGFAVGSALAGAAISLLDARGVGCAAAVGAALVAAVALAADRGVARFDPDRARW